MKRFSAKKFFSNKPAVRLFVYAVLFAAAEFMRSFCNNHTDNKHYGQLFLVLEVIFSLLMLKNALAMVVRSTDRRMIRLKAFVKMVAKSVLAPIRKLFPRANDPNAIRVRGRDERTVIFPWSLSPKKKKKRILREKINIEKCKSNTEIVRVLYASFILKMKRKGYSVKASRTPRELKHDIKNVNDLRAAKIKGIFDIYEDVRYRKDSSPDDDAVRICKEDEALFG